MGMTRDDYLAALLQLLPRGLVWVRSTTTRLAGMLAGWARTLARADARARQLGEEFDPRTTVEAIEDWEKLAGLPDCCVPSLAPTLEERRADVIRRLTSSGGQSKPYFIELAATFGLEITITEFRPFRTGLNRCGDHLCSREMSFVWRVEEAAVEPPEAVGDYEGWLRAHAQLECMFRRYQPAHTRVLFSWSAYIVTEDGSAVITTEDGTPLMIDGTMVISNASN